MKRSCDKRNVSTSIGAYLLKRLPDPSFKVAICDLKHSSLVN